MPRSGPHCYQDESLPALPDAPRNHPLVVFGDHRFCAGEQITVHRMPGPHMHSQIELNLMLSGSLTYWFDGRHMTVSTGRLVLFWGMIPHQVIDCEDDTTFVCLYAPMSAFLGLPALSRLREAIFRGAVVEALDIRPWDRDVFMRWREELLSGDPQIELIVKDELTARVRRLDREGWHDLRDTTTPVYSSEAYDGERTFTVEAMTRFIGEHALDDISVEDVAAAAGLHPNYAMALFRRSVGMSIKQSITRHRLDMAQSLLIATSHPVASIAFDCGYGSLSSFYAAFEQRFRTSPADFRKKFNSQRVSIEQ
jgi:AraC-like DNA-binding protein